MRVRYSASNHNIKYCIAVLNIAYLLAFLLLAVLADQLAALAGDDGHVRGGVFHRDDRLRLQHRETSATVSYSVHGNSDSKSTSYYSASSKNLSADSYNSSTSLQQLSPNGSDLKSIYTPLHIWTVKKKNNICLYTPTFWI